MNVSALVALLVPQLAPVRANLIQTDANFASWPSRLDDRFNQEINFAPRQPQCHADLIILFMQCAISMPHASLGACNVCRADIERGQAAIVLAFDWGKADIA